MKKNAFKVRHAAISAAMTIAVLLIAVLVNLVISGVDLELDLTRRGLYSLSDESKEMLEALDKDVTLYYLSKPGQENISIFEFLKQYTKYQQVDLVTIDPDRNPAIISKYADLSGDGVDAKTISMGSVIAVSGERSRVVPYMDLYDVSYDNQGNVNVYGFKAEQSISSAVQYVATGQQIKIYQLVGHNEYSLQDIGYAEQLQKLNFAIEEINLSTAPGVPEDASVLMILSPSWDLTVREAEKVREYLDRDGDLFIALDYTAERLKEVEGILSSWNVVVQRGFVMEQDANRLLAEFGDSPIVFAPEMVYEDITGSLTENSQSVIMMQSLGLGQPKNKLRNVKVESVLSSSKASWLRNDLNATSPNRIVTDTAGPIDVAVAVTELSLENGFPEGVRILAMGSGQSLAPLMNAGTIKANFDFLVSSLTWLADTVKTVNITSKSLYQLPLQIPSARAFIYAGLVILLIPGGIILAGLIVYLRRKRL